MRFKVKNSNLFMLPGNPHLLHLATLSYGFREFIVMVCIKGPLKGNCYIEEVVLNTVDFSNDVYANLKFIEDDSLAHDLAKFAEDKRLLDVSARLEEIFSYPLYKPIRDLLRGEE